MSIIYVVMLKSKGNVIQTDRVFSIESKAKRYANKQNRLNHERGYYYVEKCFYEK